MKQRVLVLGADSYVGRHVVTALNKSDYAQPCAVDAAAAQQVGAQLAGIDAIISCVGPRPGSIVAAASALYGELLRRDADTRVVHLSSMTVYGFASGIVSEASPPVGKLGPYAQAHVHAESMAHRYRNSVIFRPGVEFGPDCPDWSGRVARWLRAGRLGDLGAMGDGLANLIYIGDLVSLALLALRTEGIEGQIFNIAQACKPTWNDYFTMFAIALGAVPVRRISRRRLDIETRLLAVPLKALELVAHRLHLDGLRLPQAIPRSLLNLCSQEIDLNVSPAERVLGARWTRIEDGLRHAADFYHGP